MERECLLAALSVLLLLTGGQLYKECCFLPLC